MWAPEIKTKKRLRYFNGDRAYRTRHRFMVKHHRSYSQIRRLRTTKNLIEIPLLSAVCWLEQTQSFYSQVHIINGFVGGEDGGSEGGEDQADEVCAGEHEGGLALRGDAHQAALATEAGGQVDVALFGECEALRTAQAAVPGAGFAVRLDGPDGVVGAERGGGDEEIGSAPG